MNIKLDAIEELDLYEQAKHILGECSADGHHCEYDAGDSLTSRRNHVANLFRSYGDRREAKAREEEVWNFTSNIPNWSKINTNAAYQISAARDIRLAELNGTLYPQQEQN